MKVQESMEEKKESGSNSKTSTIPVEEYPVYWARIGSWPGWPARICSKPEKRNISSHKPKTDTAFIPMTFLGLKCQSGWVPAKSILKFDTTNFLSSLDKKKFVKDEDYRVAVIEACRLALASQKFDNNSAEFDILIFKNLVINGGDFEKIEWDSIEEEINSQEVCEICAGTLHSGPAIVCSNCDDSEIHLRCLPNPFLHTPEGDWYCTECSKEMRIDGWQELKASSKELVPNSEGRFVTVAQKD